MASVATAEEHDQVAAIIIDAETHLPELFAVVEAVRGYLDGEKWVTVADLRDALAALDEAKERQ